MNPLELFIALSKFNVSYDIGDTKQLSFEFKSDLADMLQANSIDFETQNGRIIVVKKTLPFSYFQNALEFVEEVRLEDFFKPIIIQDYKNTNPIYYSEEFNIDSIPSLEGDDYFITNAKVYLESKDFFKKCANANDSSFEFVDFYSDSAKTITFASISEKKRIKLSFSATGVVEMDSQTNYQLVFEEFKLLMTESKQFPVFIKKSIIKNLLSVEGNPYEHFFRKLDLIILEAKLDFNVYLHELSIDKIKADYKEYKQKYFASQNEILTKLTTQIIALPLSISGSVFAISRLEGNLLPLLIVCFGLVCYVAYVSFLVKFYVRDITSLNKQSENDYTSLSEQSFFVENKKELLYFIEIKKSIDDRLNDLMTGLKAFTIVMWVSSGLIIFYLFEAIFSFDNIYQPLIISIITCFIMGYVYSSLLFRDKETNTQQEKED